MQNISKRWHYRYILIVHEENPFLACCKSTFSFSIINYGLNHKIINLLGGFHVIVPSVCSIRTKMILNASNGFSISISQEIVWITTSWFLVHAKVCILWQMVIILLEHWNLFALTHYDIDTALNICRHSECISQSLQLSPQIYTEPSNYVSRILGSIKCKHLNDYKLS